MCETRKVKQSYQTEGTGRDGAAKANGNVGVKQRDCVEIVYLAKLIAEEIKRNEGIDYVVKNLEAQ